MWIRALLDRRSFRLVSLAVANKMARIAWAVMGVLDERQATLRVPTDTSQCA